MIVNERAAESERESSKQKALCAVYDDWNIVEIKARCARREKWT